MTDRKPASATCQPVRPAISDHSGLDGGGHAGVVVGSDGALVGKSILTGDDDGGDAEEGEVIESREEEVEKTGVLPTPYTPTQSEIEGHRVDHLPFRNLCEHCMSAFGREDAHVGGGGRHDIPIISFDCVLMSSRNVVLCDE